jgi:thiamine biosynthesis lipoprotein ApbE
MSAQALISTPAPAAGGPGCSADTTLSFAVAFDAIGTRWEIGTDEPLDADVQARVKARIRKFDRAYSRFRSDSLVSAMAAAPDGGRFEFPDDAPALFDIYDRLFAATDGALDPLVGSTLQLLGYDAAYSLTPVPPAVRALPDVARDLASRCRPREQHAHHPPTGRPRRRCCRQGLPRRPHRGDPRGQ